MARQQNQPIQIDGSTLEGGGQILRNCMVYASLLKKTIQINNIRGNRSKPGLRPQHLHGINLVREICGGQLRGNTPNSQEIVYEPSSRRTNDRTFEVDTQTAGSICLILQSVLPCLLFVPEPCNLTLKGGTNTSFAPQIDYAVHVLQPMLHHLFGINVAISIHQRGFYPRGGGVVHVQVEPVQSLPAFDLTQRGQLTHITGISLVAGKLPNHIAQRQAHAAEQELRKQFGRDININIDIQNAPCRSNGSSIILIAYTDTGCIFGGSALGDRKKKAEKVGLEAAHELIEDLTSFNCGSCTDRWLQDQLVILMALCSGRSRIKTCKITLHTETAIHFAQLLSGCTFEIFKHSDGILIECDGVGFSKADF